MSGDRHVRPLAPLLPPSLVPSASTYGQDKALFGINFPQLPLERCATEARTLDLPATARRGFLVGNARRVFGW